MLVICGLGPGIKPAPTPLRSSASGAINVTAIIASDTGLAHLAEDICWRLHAIFTEPRDVPPDVAVMVLMPLTNIARLLVREGQPITGVTSRTPSSAHAASIRA